MCLGAESAEAADISGIDLYNVCSLLSNFNEFEKGDPVVSNLNDYTQAFASLNRLRAARDCGEAEPEPDAPSSSTRGAKDVWFTSSNLAAKPVGERAVGLTATSAGLRYMICARVHTEEPVGEPVIVPGATAPLTKMENWQGST